MATEVQIYSNGTILEEDIANSAVTETKIGTSAVTETKIGTSAVTETKIGTGAVTETKIGTGAVTETKIGTGAVTETKIGTGAVTAAKLADDVSAYLSFPLGGIVMWSGTIAQIPGGWYLCDGGTYGGIKTPDLRNRFIVGSTGNGTGTAASPSAGPTFDATSGARSRNYTTHDIGGEDAHKLTIAEMPAHNHPNITLYRDEGGGIAGGNGLQSKVITNGGSVASQGGDKYHENRPLYYALAYIMKCEFRAGQTQTITTTVPTLQELRLNGPLYDQEMDGGAQKGNAGDVLTSLGDGNGVRWESRIISAQQTSSPNSKTFTDIPSWVKRITIMFNELSLSSDVDVLVQLGTSNGIITTGYKSTSSASNGLGGGSTFSNNGHVIRRGTVSGQYKGHMIITNFGENTWISSHTITIEVSGVSNFGGGVVTLPSKLTTVNIRPQSDGGTFDAGSVSLMYE